MCKRNYWHQPLHTLNPSTILATLVRFIMEQHPGQTLLVLLRKKSTLLFKSPHFILKDPAEGKRSDLYNLLQLAQQLMGRSAGRAQIPGGLGSTQGGHKTLSQKAAAAGLVVQSMAHAARGSAKGRSAVLQGRSQSLQRHRPRSRSPGAPTRAPAAAGP